MGDTRLRARHRGDRLSTIARSPRRKRASFTEAVLAGSVGRRAGGVNAHPRAGHEHRLMAIVPTHDVGRLAARALDLEHLELPRVRWRLVGWVRRPDWLGRPARTEPRTRPVACLRRLREVAGCCTSPPMPRWPRRLPVYCATARVALSTRS